MRILKVRPRAQRTILCRHLLDVTVGIVGLEVVLDNRRVGYRTGRIQECIRPGVGARNDQKSYHDGESRNP